MMKYTDTAFYLQSSVLETVASSTRTVSTSLVSTMIGLPVHLAMQAYQLTYGITIFLASQAHTISARVHDKSKGTRFETVITNITELKDETVTLVKSYVRK